MLFYCLKCRKKTETKVPNTAKTNNRKLILLLQFAVC